MENNTTNWRDRFGLATCPAAAFEAAIPEKAPGVAVIYAAGATGEQIFLVIESRASDLRSQCVKRLKTAKLPPALGLTIAFRTGALADSSPEAMQAACREQVILAGALRRALRPAMR